MRGRKGRPKKFGLFLALALAALAAFALLGSVDATWQDGLAVQVKLEAKVPPKPKGESLPRQLPPEGGNPAGSAEAQPSDSNVEEEDATPPQGGQEASCPAADGSDSGQALPAHDEWQPATGISREGGSGPSQAEENGGVSLPAGEEER